MKQLLFLCVLAVGCYASEPEIRTGFLAAKDAFVSPSFVGPVPNRLNVWVRSEDESVIAFRVAVHYEYDGQRNVLSRVIPNDAEHGAIASFVVPDVSVKVLAVNVAELKPARSFEVSR